MLFYFNRDGKFQPESSKEYKTEKGALDCMNKEKCGAVYDEEGKLICKFEETPEQTTEQTTDGSTEQTADGSTEQTADGSTEPTPEGSTEQTGVGSASTEKQLAVVTTTCDILCIRTRPEADADVLSYIEEKEGAKKEHTVMVLENGWGQLLDMSMGYIQLAYTKRV